MKQTAGKKFFILNNTANNLYYFLLIFFSSTILLIILECIRFDQQATTKQSRVIQGKGKFEFRKNLTELVHFFFFITKVSHRKMNL